MSSSSPRPAGSRPGGVMDCDECPRIPAKFRGASDGDACTAQRTRCSLPTHLGTPDPRPLPAFISGSSHGRWSSSHPSTTHPTNPYPYQRLSDFTSQR